MPGPRSKRKRTEMEAGTAAPPSASSRNRDQSVASEAGKNETMTTSSTNAQSSVDTIPSDENLQVKPIASKTKKSRGNSSKKAEKRASKLNEFEARKDQPISNSEGTEGALSYEDRGLNGNPNNNSKKSAPQPSRRNSKMVAEKAAASARGGSISNNSAAASTLNINTNTTTAAASSMQAATFVSSVAGEQTTKRSKTPTSTNSREKRIRALISHRKLLLERLQQGRTAAQNRINQLDAEDASRKSETDEEERQRFASFSKEIASLSRKQSRAESVTEGTTADGKRTSLSLRRGSSVGKRMSAALSSLAPGSSNKNAAMAAAAAATQAASSVLETGVGPAYSNNADIAVAASAAKPAPTPRGSMTLPTVSIGGARSQSAVPASSDSPISPSHGPIIPQSTHHTASTKKAAAGIMPTSAMGVAAAAPRQPKAGGNRSLAQHQQMLSRSSSQPAMGAVATSAASGGRALLISNITGMPMRRPVPPIVSVPEAVALRERKKAIETRLLMLAQNRANAKQMSLQTQPSSPQTPPSLSSVMGASSGVLASSSSASATAPLPPHAREFAVQGVGPRSRLPKRRRTHWDTLLDEMRWLATDFMEERKWKRSASRVVANAVHEEIQQRTERAASSDLISEDVEPVDVTVDMNNATNIQTEPASEISQTKPSPIEPPAKPAMKEGSAHDDLGVSERSQRSVRSHQSSKGDHSQTRDVAKASAEMVSRAWSSSAPERYADSLLADRVEVAKTREDTTSEASKVPTTPIDGKANPPSPDREKKHEDYDRISQNLEKILEQIASVRRNQPKPKSLGVDLQPHQLAAVVFSEEVWKREKVGCLFAGHESSGKTFSVCSILWKNKGSGPQLVVCSPSSLVKWFDELLYFDGIHARGVFSEGAPTPLDAATVVVCDYACLARIKQDVMKRFRTIVIDSRYPVGFRGSRPKVCLESLENASHSLLSVSAPQQLGSTDWWEGALSSILESNARRILVDSFGSSDLLGLLDGLSDRAVLEHISLRASFLFGGAIFLESFKASKKNILGWARSHIKRSKGGGGVSKFNRVRGLCCEMLDSVTFQLMSKDSYPPSLEVVACEMTPLQRSSYDYCCSNVKAALSRDLDVVDEQLHFPFRSFADALMRLRRICAHADIRATLNILSTRSHLLRNAISVLKRESPSQPNAELASAILAGSGKFKQLVHILVLEANVNLGKEMREAVKILGKPTSDTEKQDTKKVAILAVLPEVQLLISILLGALGICHELLLGFPTSTTTPESSSSKWLATQQILSRFNDKVSESSDLVNVLVASPVSVAGNHGGLGVESADVVVVVDEDWSGRGELLMRSLLDRVLFGKDKQACRFYRLVTKHSCEESFVTSLTNGTNAIDEDFRLPWPVSALGLFQPPKDLRPREVSQVRNNWRGMGSVSGILAFPATALVVSSNKKLEQVLGSEDSARFHFGVNDGSLFLPSSGGPQVETHIRVVVQLQKQEEESSLYTMDDTSHSSVIPPVPNNFVLKFSLRHLAKLPTTVLLRRIDASQFDSQPTTKRLSLQLAQTAPSTPSGRFDEMVEFLEEKEAPCPSTRNGLACGLLTYEDARTPSFGGSEAGQNAFASSFRVSTNFQFNDGSQGAELLVYFPPIFPRLLESSIIASESVQSLRRGLPSPKRILVPATGENAVKRLKTDDGEYLPISLTAETPSVITEEDATRNDAASVLLDLTDDYGLAGVGAIPLPRDSALFASQIAIENGSNTVPADVGFDRDLPIGQTPTDLSEVEELRDSKVVSQGTNSVILFVSRKRQRAMHMFQQQPRRSLVSQSSRGSNVASVSVVPNHPNVIASNGVVHNINAETGKKSAKKDANLTVFDQQPQSSLQASRMKDIHRSRLIAASRQSGPGTTLFESTPFRAASVRLKNKMSLRLSRQCWQSGPAFEAGPGLPLLVSKPPARTQSFRGHLDADPALWTSVVKRLKNHVASTGDEAVEVSIAQKSALRRSLAAPARVDFGPFHAGFLSAPSGMTAIAPPRPSLGVTLPMGVKLPQTAKDQIVSWTPTEDAKLKQSTMLFGTNWTLASRVLSGLQDVVTVSRQPQTSRPNPRAAKTCREQWQALARSDPDLAKDVRKVERTQRENSTIRFREAAEPVVDFRMMNQPAESHDGEGSNLSAQPSLLILSDLEEILEKTRTTAKGADTMNETKPAGRRRTFSAIASARKKIQEAPNAIPGMNNGSQPSIAPSHPSHMQSVQSSVASSWTGGRTEMWPLQFLDAADRYKASQTQQAASSSSSAPPRAPAAPSSVARQHSASAAGVRTSSSSLPAHPQRATSNSYPHHPPPPAARGATRVPSNAVSTAQSFVPPNHQAQPKPPPTSSPPSARK